MHFQISTKVMKKHSPVILIGDCGVGKTSYINSVIGRSSSLGTKIQLPPTIGVEYAPTTIKLKNYNKAVQANIWDTSGAEKYKSITSSYYRKCQGAIIMFDLTERKTFTHLNDWLEEINGRTGNKLQKIIIGNKVDLVQSAQSQKQVTEQELTDFCVKNQLTFRLTSAVNGSNIIESFTELLEKIHQAGVESYRNHSISDYNLANISNSVVVNQESTSISSQSSSCAKCC